MKSSAGSRDVDKFIESIKKLERSNIKFTEVYGILVSARSEFSLLGTRFKDRVKRDTTYRKNRKTKKGNKQFIEETVKYALRKGLAVLMPSGEILVFGQSISCFKKGILSPQKRKFRPIIKKRG